MKKKEYRQPDMQVFALQQESNICTSKIGGFNPDEPAEEDEEIC